MLYDYAASRLRTTALTNMGFNGIQFYLFSFDAN